MKPSAYHILRIGMAITFLWIGVLIFKEPESWGGFVQPWVVKLLPVPLREAMIGTAVLDFILGLLMLLDVWVWLAAAIASAHLIMVLTVSGIDSITVRDIGLLAATLALVAATVPDKFRFWAKK